MSKQTAANNRTLAVIKATFNGKIYKHALAIYNDGGYSATCQYLQQFDNRPVATWLPTAN